jgi:integrase
LPLAAAVTALDARETAWQSAVPMKVVTGKSALTVHEVIHLYLGHLHQRVTGLNRKRMAFRTYSDVQLTLEIFAVHCDPATSIEDIGPAVLSTFLRSPDIAGRALSTINRHNIYVRAVLNWAHQMEHRKARLNLGPDFRTISGSEWEALRGDGTRARVDKYRTPFEIRAALWAVRPYPLLYSATLLGLQGGMQQKDLSQLPLSMVDLNAGVIDFRRGKTSVGRIVPLLPITVEAIQEYLAIRPEPADPAHRHLLFISSRRRPIYRESDTGSRSDYIGAVFHKLVGWGFTSLRTTLATHADAWPNQFAIDVLLGHKSSEEMKKTRRRFYTQRLDPEIVRPLVEHVWPLAVGQIGPLPLLTPEGQEPSTGEAPASPQTPSPEHVATAATAPAHPAQSASELSGSQAAGDREP